MPIDLETHNPDETIDVSPDTNEAEALCFLYANSEYGYRPAEVRKHTSIPENSAYKALVRLHEKDLIGKTSDGYYHALADPHIARYVDSLRKGREHSIDTGKDEYPDDIEETTSGHPSEPAITESLVEGGDAGKESFPGAVADADDEHQSGETSEDAAEER